MSLQRTNIEIDPQKIKMAKKLTGLKTAKEIVNFALDRLAQTSWALDQIFKSEGRVKLHSKYSYKKER